MPVFFLHVLFGDGSGRLGIGNVVLLGIIVNQTADIVLAFPVAGGIGQKVPALQDPVYFGMLQIVFLKVELLQIV